jgi:hypothetical protein
MRAEPALLRIAPFTRLRESCAYSPFGQFAVEWALERLQPKQKPVRRPETLQNKNLASFRISTKHGKTLELLEFASSFPRTASHFFGSMS